MEKMNFAPYRKLIALLVFAVVCSFASPEISANNSSKWEKAKIEKMKKIEKKKQLKKQRKQNKQKNTVGAPLDGGLVTILLGSAGAAYFVRKRKQNKAE